MIWYWYSLCCFPGAHWLFRGKGCDCGEELRIETMQITLPSTRIEIMQPSLYLLGSKVISLGEEPLQGDSVLLELLEHKESHKVGILRPRTEREHGSWELDVWPTSSVWFLRPDLRVLLLFLCIWSIPSLSVIPETSFESKKFQDFVSIGAQRWLEVIEDWTTFGKVTSHF